MRYAAEAREGKEARDLTRAHILIPWEAQGGPPPTVIDHAKGCYLYTSDGARILDFSSGLTAVNAGHGHPKIVDAIRRQAARLAGVAAESGR